MSAKEMFEELGYKLYEYSSNWFRYRKYILTEGDEDFDKDDAYYDIFFNIKHKFYVCEEINDNHEGLFIDIKLHKAINKQIEELGWNNE